MSQLTSSFNNSRLEPLASSTTNSISVPTHQVSPQIPNMEFGRRLSSEKELDRMPAYSLANTGEYDRPP